MNCKHRSVRPYSPCQFSLRNIPFKDIKLRKPTVTSCLLSVNSPEALTIEHMNKSVSASRVLVLTGSFQNLTEVRVRAYLVDTPQAPRVVGPRGFVRLGEPFFADSPTRSGYRRWPAMGFLPVCYDRRARSFVRTKASIELQSCLCCALRHRRVQI